MRDLPRITVIMGIYNCADTLVEALKSLESQTYKNFKVVLCDDGSKDDTLQVALRWAEEHPNYLVIQNEHNIKLAATLNHCLGYVDTEYVARMDGDDISLPTRFEKEIAFWMHIRNLLLSVLLWLILTNVVSGVKVRQSNILKTVILRIVHHSVMLLVWLGNQRTIW